MIVLGVSGIDDVFHDSSATLVVDGRIVASVEEERFNRRKHSNGLPFEAIAFCARKAGISFADIDHVGYYLDPEEWIRGRHTDLVKQGVSLPRIVERFARIVADNIRGIEGRLRARFSFRSDTQFHYVNHHLAHASSAFHISGFESAAVLTVDGAGERESCVVFAGGPDGVRKVEELLLFPQSLGLLYNFIAAHLGLGWVEGPGKLMGLAGYGNADPHGFDDILRLRDDARRPVEVDTSFFDFFRLATEWTRWSRSRRPEEGRLAAGREEGAASPPRASSALSDKALSRFGEPVPEGGPLLQCHLDLAASVQLALERALLHIVRHVRTLLPRERNLCLAGGVALNVTTNRRILDSGSFERLFVTPPAGDGGTSLGCALHVDARHSRRWRYDFDVYCGPHIEEDFDVAEACASFGDAIVWEHLDEEQLISRAAECLVKEELIGWVQGRMECGPRALGNRSILANAMVPDIKERLNARVKKREAFRPYAPSVLREESAKWFDLDDSPYMLLEATVKPNRRNQVPGIVHVDGSSRPQTVTEAANPRYYWLLRRFFEQTGVPMVLNTSFNRHGEPIVNRVEEAITVLLETELDALFVGCYQIRRRR